MVPPVVLGIGSGRLLDELRDGPLDDRVVLLLVIAVVAGVLTSIGTIVYAGVLDELVGSVVRDDRRPSISEVVHALPIGRLIGADVLVTVLIAPASALGAVPGFVLLTLLAIVGPVVNIEDARPFPAIVRSLRLTARHLWLTMLAVGLPLLDRGRRPPLAPAPAGGSRRADRDRRLGADDPDRGRVRRARRRSSSPTRCSRATTDRRSPRSSPEHRAARVVQRGLPGDRVREALEVLDVALGVGVAHARSRSSSSPTSTRAT